MTTHAPARPTRSTRSTGWVPIALVAPVLVPAIVIGVAVIVVQFYKRPSYQAD